MLGWPAWILIEDLGWRSPSLVCWRGRLLGASDTLWIPAHIFCQSSFMSLFQKSSKQLFHSLRNDQSMRVVWLLLMRSDARCVGHVEGKEKKKKKAKAIHSFGELKQRAIFGHFVWVLEWAKTQRDIQPLERCSPCEEIERNTMRVWVKKKKETFFFPKLHTRKINWWGSHGGFECYNHGELDYSEKDFATRFVVRLYLLLEIYLLYI